MLPGSGCDDSQDRAFLGCLDPVGLMGGTNGDSLWPQLDSLSPDQDGALALHAVEDYLGGGFVGWHLLARFETEKDHPAFLGIMEQLGH